MEKIEHINNYVIDNENKIGTKFSKYAKPKYRTAGNELEPYFENSSKLSAESDCPTSKWAINPDEKLQLRLKLKKYNNFSDLLSQMNSAKTRIGLHVLSLPDGSSESAVSVPEPASIIVLGIGSLSAIYKKR